MLKNTQIKAVTNGWNEAKKLRSVSEYLLALTEQSVNKSFVAVATTLWKIETILTKVLQHSVHENTAQV